MGLRVTLGASVLAGQSWRARGVVLLLWCGSLAFGVTRPAVREGDRAALLVQGNVDPRDKLAGQGEDAWQRYLTLNASGLQGRPVPELVLWPETAVPWATRPPTLAVVPAPVVLGGSLTTGGSLYNSALLSARGVASGRHDKVKLVPFGEFSPGRQVLDGFYRQVFAALGLPPMQGLIQGRCRAPLVVGPITAGVLICYESTFPSLAQALVRRGANVLVTLSNDAWFGATLGVEQHFQMGRVRAIETRRWWLRAGNDRITAVVSPSGMVMRRFPRFVARAFPVVFGLRSGETLAVRWGDAVPLVAALAWLVGGWMVRGRIGVRPIGLTGLEHAQDSR